MDRSVTVKGLSEREYVADTVIWLIQFTAASNQLSDIYQTIEQGNNSHRILKGKGVKTDDFGRSSPITDKSAQRYGSGQPAEFRYTATQTITVYSTRVETIRDMMSSLSELGKQGMVLSTDDYQAQPGIYSRA